MTEQPGETPREQVEYDLLGGMREKVGRLLGRLTSPHATRGESPESQTAKRELTTRHYRWQLYQELRVARKKKEEPGNEKDIFRKTKKRVKDRILTALNTLPIELTSKQWQSERQEETKSLVMDSSTELTPYQSATAAIRLDRIQEKLTNRRERVTVDVEHGGTVSAEWILLDTEEKLAKGEENLTIIIPGITNDIASMEGLLDSAGIMAKPVLYIPYPGSQMGEITQQWIDGLKSETNFSMDAEFFKKAIQKILQSIEYDDSRPIDIIGQSYGAATLVEMLNDEDFSQRIQHAAVVTPAACVDQHKAILGIEIAKGVVHELMQLVPPHLDQLLQFQWVFSRRDIDKPDVASQKKIKDTQLPHLLRKVYHPNTRWKTAKVQDGGTITFVHGGRDGITSSRKMVSETSRLAQETHNFHIQSVTAKKLAHLFITQDPFSFLHYIDELWKKENGTTDITVPRFPQYGIAKWAKENIPSTRPETEEQT